MNKSPLESRERYSKRMEIAKFRKLRTLNRGISIPHEASRAAPWEFVVGREIPPPPRNTWEDWNIGKSPREIAQSRGKIAGSGAPYSSI